MKTYSLYTDGAISNNGDKNGTGIMEGGIGWLLLDENGEDIAYGRGFYPSTLPPEEPVTNNRMELSAYIEAMINIEGHNLHPAKDVRLVVYSDSAYFINSINEYIKKWQVNGWRNNAGQPIKNKDLWLQILRWRNDKSMFREVRFVHVKGHNGHKHQERVDKLAVASKKDRDSIVTLAKV